MPTVALTHTEDQGPVLQRRPEKRPSFLRSAAGAERTPWGNPEVVRRITDAGLRASNRNELNANTFASNKWRTSPVPAPAVIPAPLTYFDVVAVKTLVVESDQGGGLNGDARCHYGTLLAVPCSVSSLVSSN